MRIVANEHDEALEAQRRAIGGNRPPADHDALAERLQDDHEALLAEAEALIRQIDAMPARITSEDQRHKASDFAALKLAETAKRLEDLHGDEKAPYLEGAKTCDRLLLAPAKLLRDGKRKVERLIGAFLAEVEERERQARAQEAARALAEAERLRHEAETAAAQAETDEALEGAVAAEDKAADAYHEADKAQQAAEAAPADLTRSRSISGTLSSLSVKPELHSFNRTTVELEPLRPYLSQKEIEKAIKAFIRAGNRTLGGADIREVPKATVRSN